MKKQFSGADLGQTLQDGCLVKLTWRDVMTQLFSPPPRHNEQLQKIITKGCQEEEEKVVFVYLFNNHQKDQGDDSVCHVFSFLSSFLPN